MAHSPPSPRFDCFPRILLSRVCKPCIWEELKRRAFGFLSCFGLVAITIKMMHLIYVRLHQFRKKKRKKKEGQNKNQKKKKMLMQYLSPKSLLVLAVAPTKAVVKKFKCLQTLLSETCLQKL